MKGKMIEELRRESRKIRKERMNIQMKYLKLDVYLDKKYILRKEADDKKIEELKNQENKIREKMEREKQWEK